MKFTAVGDVLIQKEWPGEYDGLSEVVAEIRKGDFRFFNLETTLNDGEYWASQYCGGSYLRVSPSILNDLKTFGFNVVNICNNHSMDFSYDGLLRTISEIKNANLIQAGTGRNLDEASAPAYLGTSSGRVGFIGVTSSFNTVSRAGRQSRRFIGRPGVNGMRYDEIYTVSEDDLEVLSRIAIESQINSRNNVRRLEGYLEDQSVDALDFKGLFFKAGDRKGRVSIIDENDWERIKNAIEEATFQADYAIVSIHTHQMKNGDKEKSDFFIEEFAHRCIDFGASAVIGHGPHQLRGIEVYKDRPIFYSLGNFIFHNENIPYAPEDFYSKYNLNSDCSMYDLFEKRSNGFTRGLQTKEEVFQTIIPYWEIIDGKLTELSFTPVNLGFGVKHSQSGWPRLDKSEVIIKKMQSLSKEYGTSIRIEGNRGIII